MGASTGPDLRTSGDPAAEAEGRSEPERPERATAVHVTPPRMPGQWHTPILTTECPALPRSHTDAWQLHWISA